MRNFTPSFEEADKMDKENRVFSNDQLNFIAEFEKKCASAGCDDEHKCMED